jgi:cell division septum initiation protein DivIVA
MIVFLVNNLIESQRVRLTKENEQLRMQVDELKKQLIALEIAEGGHS